MSISIRLLPRDSQCQVSCRDTKKTPDTLRVTKLSRNTDMDAFLLSRELGNLQGFSSLELEYTTRLTHSIQRTSGISFCEGHPTGTNALDIERQTSRYMLSAGADASISMWDLDFTSLVPGYQLAKLDLRLEKPNHEIPAIHVPKKDMNNRASSKSHKFGITTISFYPSDHGLFITSSYDHLVHAWDTTLFTTVYSFVLTAPIHAAAMAPKSFHTLIAATTSQFPAIRLLDLNTGASTHSLGGHTEAGALGLGWSPRDEYMLASGGVDGTVRVWDIRRTANSLACLSMENEGWAKNDVRNLAHHGPVNGVRWNEDGTILVTLGLDEKMRVWDMATGRNKLTNFGHLRNRHNLVLPPVLTPLRMSDPQLVFTPSDAEILGFDINNGTLLKRLESPQAKKVNALIQRPNRLELYSAAIDGSITVWVPEASDREEEEEKSKDSIVPGVID